MVYNPVICAVDTTDIGHARALCRALDGHVGALKLGLEFFTAHGAAGVQQVMAENPLPLFLDLKFHDIPHTVARAIRAAAPLAPALLTIHTLGGKDMLRAAVEAARDSALPEKKTNVLGVTVLTSLDENDLPPIGIGHKMDDQVCRLARLAQEAGLDGVICSPHEIEVLRRECGKDFLLVVPGIRPDGAQAGDQKRVLTPKEALLRGADYLVIGRPITAAANPADAARTIAESIHGVMRV